ncbi:hypothetical protein [Microbispora sp. H10836]|uniref:hypothetical protein n=1 Tax=Microbispora sp. H10836 TaxID=2729106 RepID=UPI00147535B1|nr:hypothetical protein [Microbispora sp. H10836]
MISWRGRLGRGPAGGAVVALLLATSASYPVEMLDTRFLQADGCPNAVMSVRGTADRPGPLVPAEGAVSVTLCELIAPLRSGPGPMPSPRPGRDRTLSTRVAEMIAVLNALPRRDEAEAAARALMTAQGGTPPEDLHMGEACTAVGYGEQLSFAVRYRDRPPALLLLDRNCALVHHAGRTRFLWGDPVDRFLFLYREQIARDPTSVPAPTCPDTVAVAEVDNRPDLEFPEDGMARNRGRDDEFLPGPLAVVTACRYRADGADLQLRAHRVLREDLEPIRGLLNAAATIRSVTDSQGTTDFVNGVDCGAPDRTRAATPISRLDVVWVTDTTGAVAEIRIWRAPCQAVFSGTAAGLRAEPALLSRLDSWLGR